MKKLMVIAALFLFMTGTAYADAEWNFYGSARVSTFYTDWDKSILDADAGANPITGTGPDTTNFEMDLNGNARIGANVKVNDKLTARFEFGAKGGDDRLRILWGEYDFGKVSLGMGTNYTPLLFPYSNQVYNIYEMEDGDTNMSLFGMLYGKREPMVRLKAGTFQIAIVKPRDMVHSELVYSGTTAGQTAYVTEEVAHATALGTYVAGVTELTAGATYVAANIGAATYMPDTKVRFPSIQAKYRYDFSMGHLNFAAGFQTFDVLDNNEEFSVDSYVLGLGGRLNVGKFYFKGNIWGGQNVGNLADIFTSGQIFSTMEGASDRVRDGAGMGFARFSDGSLNTASGGTMGAERGITDNDALAGLIVVGYEIRRGLYLEGGWGYTETELDVTGATKQEAQTWYLQSTIFLAEGVFLTPEIGGLEVKDDDLDVFYGGMKWQINF